MAARDGSAGAALGAVGQKMAVGVRATPQRQRPLDCGPQLLSRCRAARPEKLLLELPRDGSSCRVCGRRVRPIWQFDELGQPQNGAAQPLALPVYPMVFFVQRLYITLAGVSCVRWIQRPF
jgi:hypothetical protein